MVLAAGDGLEALEIARAEHPRIALADVMMPRMDGVELCWLLRSDPTTSAMVVLLMSAAIVAGPSGCGADRVLRKPLELDILHETVHRYLAVACDARAPNEHLARGPAAAAYTLLTTTPQRIERGKPWAPRVGRTRVLAFCAVPLLRRT